MRSMKGVWNSELLNTILVGLVFMFVYTAFYTISNLEKLLLHSVQVENESYTGDGFVSLSIFYTSFAVFLWIVPLIIQTVGLKIAILLGAIGFSLFLASFLPEVAWVLYLGSVFNGLGAALVWTAQGPYNVLNSTSNTITRNVAIFTGLCHLSLLHGNVFLFVSFSGETIIDQQKRTLVVSVLLGISLLGVLIAAFLPSPTYKHLREKDTSEFKDIFLVMKNPNMVALCPMFVYCGLQISYFSGIFGAAVGFTKFEDGYPSDKLVAVVGFCTGIGEIIAEMVLVPMNRLVARNPWLRSLLVLFACLVQCVAYLLSYINFADDSIFGPTTQHTVIGSRSWVAVVIAICLGYGDGTYMPMLVSLVSKMYPDGRSSVFTLDTFFFSFSSAIVFYYSSYVGLHVQLIILAVGGVIGSFCFCWVNKHIDWSK